MICISATKRTNILNQIAKKEAQLLKLEEALDDASTGVKEYRFDSGEGSQRTIRHSPAELIRAIEVMESKIAALYRRLNGTGLVDMNMRRKSHRTLHVSRGS